MRCSASLSVAQQRDNHDQEARASSIWSLSESYLGVFQAALY
jgi:hypothetical protein